MNNVNPVGWFEIPATDLNRAARFYEAVFGFDMSRKGNAGYDMVWFPAVDDSKGISGALVAGMGYLPSLEGATVYFTAPNIDVIIAKIEPAGGKIHVAKKAIGEYGYIAIFSDSEGNRVGLHSRKTS